MLEQVEQLCVHSDITHFLSYTYYIINDITKNEIYQYKLLQKYESAVVNTLAFMIKIIQFTKRGTSQSKLMIDTYIIKPDS